MTEYYSNGRRVTKLKRSYLLGYYCDLPHIKNNKCKCTVVKHLKSLGYKKYKIEKSDILGCVK